MIAIPNTDKPKGCIDCPVNDMVCELWTEVANIKAHKHKDCPLIDIVTCGECKYYEREYCRLDPFWERDTEPNDFCSRGERKEE